MTRCPVMNEHVPVLMEMRRHLVGEGDMDKSLQEALKNLTRYGNSFGAAPRARPKWTQQLQFSIKDARKEPVHYLWFVGDYASYDPRVAAATCAAARVFHKAGLDFGILYEGEQNSGNDVRLAGEEGLFETLRDKNLNAFAKAHFDEIVTTDPHSFHVLKHEYPATNGGRSVLHHTQLLSDLILSGRTAVAEEAEDDGDVPRSVLPGALQRHLQRSPPRDGRFGAEAGRDAAEPHLRVLLRRRRRPDLDGRSAGDQGAAGDDPGARGGVAQGVHTLVVACPKDLVMFQDAIKTTGLEDKLEVKELSELVEQAMG